MIAGLILTVPVRAGELPDDVAASLTQSRELAAEQQYNAAILLLEGQRTLHGDLPELLAALGSIYRELRLWDESIRFYRRATRLDPGSAEFWAGLGGAYFEAHQPDSSRVAFLAAWRLDATRAETAGYLGELALEAGDLAHAREYFLRRLELEGENFDALTDLAVVHERSSDWASARPYLERAVELAPELPEAHYNLAILEANNGRFHEAVVEANRALERDPEYLDALRFLAVLYFENQVCDEAVRYFEQVLLVDPLDREVRIGLASCLHSLGETDRAVLELKTLINHLGEDYDLLLIVADFRLEQNQLDEALEMASRAAALDVQRPDAHYLLGLTYRKLGLEDQALREFQTLDDLREAERVAKSQDGAADPLSEPGPTIPTPFSR
ncbi:MAG: tetratricopeptide repeat protein [Candidatus Eisenbacteria bacterium]|uniref:Tetratricopeptide repeat protein n=1 Tax=Eiseniibacteriota bacterium TaxID=2212470 RepID=A0A956LWJ4_UNCEI|nr:tetratricopeptide repeat protein [Candidatus Eisenbacteria bacterium]